MHLPTRLGTVLAALLLIPAAVASVLLVPRPSRPADAGETLSSAEIATEADRRALREELDAFIAERRVVAAGADVTEVAAPTDGVGPSPTTVWDRIADCESGDWDADGQPIPGTARWDYGLAFDHGDIFEGGLNFHPGTWDAFRDPGMPDHAGHASRAQQIMVGERVLAEQGWGAWPVCGRKLGLR